MSAARAAAKRARALTLWYTVLARGALWRTRAECGPVPAHPSYRDLDLRPPREPGPRPEGLEGRTPSPRVAGRRAPGLRRAIGEDACRWVEIWCSTGARSRCAAPPRPLVLGPPRRTGTSPTAMSTGDGRVVCLPRMRAFGGGPGVVLRVALRDARPARDPRADARSRHRRAVRLGGCRGRGCSWPVARSRRWRAWPRSARRISAERLGERLPIENPGRRAAPTRPRRSTRPSAGSRPP